MIRYVVTFAALLLCLQAPAQSLAPSVRTSAPLVLFFPTASLFAGQGVDNGIYIQLKSDGTSVHMELSEDGPPMLCTGTYELTPNILTETVNLCGQDFENLKPIDAKATTTLTSNGSTFSDFFARATLGKLRSIRPSDPSLSVQVSVWMDGQNRVTESRSMVVFEGELPK